MHQAIGKIKWKDAYVELKRLSQRLSHVKRRQAELLKSKCDGKNVVLQVDFFFLYREQANRHHSQATLFGRSIRSSNTFSTPTIQNPQHR